MAQLRRIVGVPIFRRDWFIKFLYSFGAWRSWLARLLWEQEAASSSLAAPKLYDERGRLRRQAASSSLAAPTLFGNNNAYKKQ